MPQKTHSFAVAHSFVFYGINRLLIDFDPNNDTLQVLKYSMRSINAFSIKVAQYDVWLRALKIQICVQIAFKISTQKLFNSIVSYQRRAMFTGELRPKLSFVYQMN